MPDASDMELLRDYDRQGSEAAFAELVRRHINLVYSVAVRHVGIAAQAEEITQAVFIILARKAAGLRPDTILEGWLHETTRLTALSFLRGEHRRQFREQEACMQSTLQESTDASVWNQLAPLLDEAVARLGKKDREAVVLRFFKEKNLGEVAAAMKTTEAAVQSRVYRALEKLRKYFVKRGVNSTTATIAGSISANSVQAAPVALDKSVTAVAIAKGATASGSILTVIKGALKIMAWTKAKTAIVVSVAAVLAVGTATITVKVVGKSFGPSVESYFTHPDRDYLHTAPTVMLLRPSRYANQESILVGGRDKNGDWDGRVMRRGAPFTQILFNAYGFGPEQMILPRNLPRGQYDMLLTSPTNTLKAMQEMLVKEIKRQFGLVAHSETRVTNILVLKSVNPNAPGLKISAGGGRSSRWPQPGNAQFFDCKMSDPSGLDLTHEIGLQANIPVVDETGLTNAYDIDLHWNPNLQGDALKNDIRRAMKEQLGLVLVPDRRQVEMLVVEKMK